MTDTDFFLSLLKRGEILKCESGASGWISRIKLDDQQYVLTISRAHDQSDAWDYRVTDVFENLIAEGQYTKIN